MQLSLQEREVLALERLDLLCAELINQAEAHHRERMRLEMEKAVWTNNVRSR